MGLDGYLNRMPRCKKTTANEVSAIEGYLDWLDAKANNDKNANCTMEEWCGVDESGLPSKDVIDFYRPFYTKRYSYRDTEHKYGYNRIMEQVGYWRKSNQIHAWFINHVQDGEDDCRYHDECTKEILEELLDTCRKVLESCVMTYGKVKNGERLVNGKWEPIYENGMTVIDSSVAEELLPSCDGFFFGGTNYDQWYVDDITNTIEILEKVLATTDFKTQMLAYCSSW